MASDDDRDWLVFVDKRRLDQRNHEHMINMIAASPLEGDCTVPSESMRCWSAQFVDDNGEVVAEMLYEPRRVKDGSAQSSVHIRVNKKNLRLVNAEEARVVARAKHGDQVEALLGEVPD